jgi:V/A-type H+-transporting ATPase subunit I
LRDTVNRATDGRAVLELAEPGPEDVEQGRVPSYIVHSRLFAPFERLVSGYGVASYKEIEPTLLFAVSFLLMFGVIFGDIGDGLCLFVAGLLANRRGKTAGFRDIGYVVAAAGVVSMVFGTFFQGSFFGKSLLDMGFPLTLGYEPIRFEGGEGSASTYVTRYLVLAMLFGIVLISAGAVLNIVNLFRRRDYGELLLNRFGVVGIVFYWGALALAIKVAVAGSSESDVWLAAGVLGVPLVVLALHGPLHALLTHHRPIWGESPMVGLFEGVIEAMETAMIYVANTFSFLRVAAFALSHAALSFTIFVMQQMVNGLPGGPVWSGVVFVVGTATIVGLEGLIVTIQIMRLEYYEFFTKFFGGEGVRYEPFRLE